MAEHLLVVEDDEALRTTLQLELEEAGYRVSTAADGMTAVDMARKEYFDLVISDVRMPGLDGLDALSSIRQIQPMARAIVITGYANPNAPVRALKLKVDDYLLKPFSSRQLLDSVQAALVNYRREALSLRPAEDLRESVARLVAAVLFESRFPHLLGHSERVAGHCLGLARELGFSAQRQSNLYLAALLHDVGQGRLDPGPHAEELSPEDREMVKHRPALARELLEPFPGMRDIAMIIFHHHERWDGTGYPRGLRQQGIPLESRILAVAEAYDEQICQRGKTSAQALCHLEDESGSGFDPELVPVFRGVVERARLELPVPAPAVTDSSKPLFLLHLAEVYAELGNLEVASSAYTRAEELISPNEIELRLRAEMGRAQLLTRQGNAEEALRRAKAGLSMARAAGLDFTGAQAVLQVARLSQASRELLEWARDIFIVWESTYHLCLAELFLGLAPAGPDQPEEPGRSYRAFVSGVLAGEHFEVLQRYPGEVEQLLLKGLEQGLAPVDTDALLRLGVPHSLEILERLLGSQDAVIRLRVVEILETMATGQARALLARAQADSAREVALKASRALSQMPGSGRETLLQVFFFGPFRLVVGDELFDDECWPTRKIRSLFAYMAARRGEVIHEDRLVGLFWEDFGEKQARHSLHNSVSQIRRLLGQRLDPSLRDKLLVKRNLGYVIPKEAPCRVDLEDFQEHYCRGKYLAGRERWDEALLELQKLERLYRGELMEGSYDEWCPELRLRAQAQLVESLGIIGRYFQNKGKPAVAIDAWRKILARDNCNEDAWSGLVECLLALGRHSEAVASYHQCAKTLKKELDLAPPARLVELYLKVIQAKLR